VVGIWERVSDRFEDENGTRTWSAAVTSISQWLQPVSAPSNHSSGLNWTGKHECGEEVVGVSEVVDEVEVVEVVGLVEVWLDVGKADKAADQHQ
jgi:hypothetical protein